MGDWPQATFCHEAMAAIFRITVAHGDSGYARQAAAEAWGELDRLEARLSRFIASSDIARIGRLGAGQQTVVHPDTWQCLQIAAAVEAQTGGAFDVAYAVRQRFGPGRLWDLDPQRPVVRALVSGVHLDLGGIGKGFALDRLAGLLADWDVRAVLLDAGHSTVLAREAPPGEPGWPVRLGEIAHGPRLALHNRAIASSGTGVRGYHIVEPRSGQPVRRAARAWVLAETAAEADALSTALLVLGPHGARSFLANQVRVEAYWQEEPSQVPCVLTL